MSHIPYYGQEDDAPNNTTSMVDTLAQHLLTTAEYICTIQQTTAKQLAEYSKAVINQMYGIVD